MQFNVLLGNHKLRVESEIGRLTPRETISNNLREESRWINWRARAVNCVHVKINDIFPLNGQGKML
jgi:hypothetical protein